jgi:hypothetical protein
MKAMKRTAFSMAFCGLATLLPASAGAQASAPPGEWKFSLTPYLWMPTVGSTVQYTLPASAGGGTATVEKDPGDYLSNLDMALMLSGEARKGRSAIFTDFIFLDFSNESGQVKTLGGPGGMVQVPVNVNTTTGLKGGVWQLAASHNFSQSSTSSFEVLGGFRYLKLESAVTWQLAGPLGAFPQAGSAKQTAELWDAIVGVRGKAKLDANWFVPWYLDAGAGDSKLTYQAMAGIGYAFEWGDLLLAYRHLSYEQKDSKPIQELQMSGVALGATFHF